MRMAQSQDSDHRDETMPPGREWRREPLDWMLAKRFSRVIRSGDRVECRAGGMGPYQSMLYAIQHGPCWAALEGTDCVPVGVWGWTHEGAVWSYWTDLDRVQSLELLRRTPEMVADMVKQAQDAGLTYLANMVWEQNTPALNWLVASKCFEVDLDHRFEIDNKQFIRFKTKPLEDIRRHV